MSYYADILEPKGDKSAAIDELSNVLAKLYYECCEKTHKKPSNTVFSINAPAVSQMWLNGSLKLFVLYEASSKQPVGMLLGTVYRPMVTDCTVFQIEEFYVKPEHSLGEMVLVNFVYGAIRFIGCNEIWMPDKMMPPDGWAKYDTITYNKYSKYGT